MTSSHPIIKKLNINKSSSLGDLGGFMNLIIDIGNSRTKIGIFYKDELIEIQYPTILDIKFLKNIKQTHPTITHALLSASGDYQKTIIKELETDYHFMMMNPTLHFPVKSLYKTPQALGSDRLAGVVGANYLFPKQNNLVIDTGTCITIDFIDKTAVYNGGAIMPGISTKFNSLHTFTKNLPLLKHANNLQPSLIGQNTEESIRSGVLNGTLYEIEGFIKSYTDRYNSLNVVFTGGESFYFIENLKIRKISEPNLVLKGLNVILNINAATK